MSDSESYLLPEFSADKLDLPAGKSESFNFDGHIVEPDLEAVGSLISAYLNGAPKKLKVKAESIDSPAAVWLLDAFQKNALDISLPKKKHEVRIAILSTSHN